MKLNDIWFDHSFKESWICIFIIIISLSFLRSWSKIMTMACSEYIINHVNNSIGSLGNSLSGDWIVLIDVRLRDDLIFSFCKSFIDVLGNRSWLPFESTKVKSFLIGFRYTKSFKEVFSLVFEIGKGGSGERSLWALMVLIDDGVPNSMELIGSVVVLSEE